MFCCQIILLFVEQIYCKLYWMWEEKGLHKILYDFFFILRIFRKRGKKKSDRLKWNKLLQNIQIGYCVLYFICLSNRKGDILYTLHIYVFLRFIHDTSFEYIKYIQHEIFLYYSKWFSFSRRIKENVLPHFVHFFSLAYMDFFVCMCVCLVKFLFITRKNILLLKSCLKFYKNGNKIINILGFFLSLFGWQGKPVCTSIVVDAVGMSVI